MEKSTRAAYGLWLGVIMLGSAVSGGGAFAAEGTERDSGNVFQLGEIDVLAKGEEQAGNTTVEKVYAEELRQFDRNTVGDAADLLPGVTLSRTGARNEQTLYVRGFDIKHVPLFLDGIPIYVPYDGYPDLGRFTTFDLSEVVISKGFTSVLYGPNTMGGAINMVSRRPQKELEGAVGAGYATGDAYSTYFNLGTNQGKWYLQTSASYVDSDHFDLSDDFKAVKTEDGDERQNSYYRDEKVNVKVGYTPKDDDEYALSYTYQHGKKGTPPYTGSSSSETVRYWQWPYWDKSSYYFTSKTGLPAKSYLKTRFYYDAFENSLYSYDDDTYSTISKKYAFKSWYDDYTYGGSMETGTSALNYNLIKLAVHLKEDVHREHNEGKPVQTFKDEIVSTGLEDTVTFSEKLRTIAGVSYDYLRTRQAEDLNSQNQIIDFEKGTTDGFNPQIGFFYTPIQHNEFHASAARKNRLPSIKDKYSYKLGKGIPNPDLNPEISNNYEVGYMNSQLDNWQFKGNLFYNDVSDFIQQVVVVDPDDPTQTKYQNHNIEEVDLSGFELEATGYLMTDLEVGANYTYTHAENKSSDDELTSIPKHKIFAYLRYLFFGHLRTQFDMEYDSKRYSSSDGIRVADGYTVFNCKVGYEFTKGYLVEAGVDNIFDENYAIEEGFPEAGRTLFANVRYTF